ncbi:aminopeptidase N-like [Panulirus ornatus]|uniref:aminopeptidase N-like n=1 Tax=Panulirus ornatus TaxID=150431 RepID=UPI003A887546
MKHHRYLHLLLNRRVGDIEDIRLPLSVRPVHYVVKLQPFLHGNRSVHGQVEIEVEVFHRTSNITLHVADIHIRRDTVRVSPLNKRRSYLLRQQLYDRVQQQYTVQLRRRLRPGKAYLLRMSFRGALTDFPWGFYVTSYKDSEDKERIIAVTQFWATNARRVFPCFDEPEMKATFTLYIAREGNMTALSNMPLVATTSIPGQEEWVWDQFATTLHMSTYLVAFAIVDYSSRTTDDSRETRVNVWTRPEVLEQTGLALEAATSSLNFFTSFFNISYPLQKLDMIAVPSTAFSGMENWGLIVYREYELLWDPEVASTPARSKVSELVSHEVAHQWFGNLVTFKWWNDLWLNEGFATYMATVAVHEMEPSWRMLDQFLVTKVQQVMKGDALRTSHPLSVSVSDPAEINQVFDEIPYRKGAAVIRMMQHFLTADTFKKGLTSYLSAKRYDNADQDDLWRFMTTAAHEDGSLPPQVSVKTIMDTWTRQEGFPVIYVSRDHNGTARLTQYYVFYNLALSTICRRLSIELGSKNSKLRRAGGTCGSVPPISQSSEVTAQPSRSYTINNSVSPNVAEAVYCAGVQRGGQNEWEFAWRQFHFATSTNQKEALGMALGCSSQAWLLSRYLEAAITGESGLQREDIIHVFSAVINSDVGSFLAWQYFVHNLHQIEAFVDGDFTWMSNMVKAVTQHFTAADQVEQLLKLLSQAEDQTTVSALETAVETVQNNLDWRKKNYRTIVRWLNQHGFTHTLTVI